MFHPPAWKTMEQIKYSLIYNDEIFDTQILNLSNIKKSLEKGNRILDFIHDAEDIEIRLNNSGYSLPESSVIFIVINNNKHKKHNNEVYNRFYSRYRPIIQQFLREDKISELLE